MPGTIITQDKNIINYMNELNISYSFALKNSMANMVSGIVLTKGNKNVSTKYSKITCNKHRSSGSRFLWNYNWNNKHVDEKHIDYFLGHVRGSVSESSLGFLIIDDTLSKKDTFTNNIEGLDFHNSHADGNKPTYGASIEAELGRVGDNENSAEGNSYLEDPSKYYTDPKMAKDYVEKTGVDALAIAVGTAHGAYKLPPKLDFERIQEIAQTVDVPLVLHGGSGLTNDDFRIAIQKGICKVNIFTDINVAAAESVKKSLSNSNKGFTELIPSVVEAVKQETIKKMILFSSDGKAENFYK